MTIYASTKMDITCYLEWFKNRLKQGFFDKEVNEKTINRYHFEKTDKIILYTRNPEKLYRERLFFSDYNVDLITFISMYDKFFEPEIKNKLNIIDEIKKCKKYFNNYLGYGPIFFTEIHNKEWHKQQFEFLCNILHKYIKGVYISFSINTYCQKNTKIKAYQLMGDEQKQIYGEFKTICDKYGLELYIMKTESSFNDDEIDIGITNCCPNVCEYCPYVINKKAIKQKYKILDSSNTLLYGMISKNQKIKDINLENKPVDKNVETNTQLNLFTLL